MAVYLVLAAPVVDSSSLSVFLDVAPSLDDDMSHGARELIDLRYALRTLNA